jgi:hypothetical protein
VSFEGTAGWAVGPKGTVARFKSHFRYEIHWSPQPPAPTATSNGK